MLVAVILVLVQERARKKECGADHLLFAEDVRNITHHKMSVCHRVFIKIIL